MSTTPAPAPAAKAAANATAAGYTQFLSCKNDKKSASGATRAAGQSSSSGPKKNDKESENQEKKHTPDSHPKEFTKKRHGPGYEEKKTGLTWKKDKLHKDHWDVSDSKGKKVKEVDFNG